jgi:anti-sigma-K factor RskA
VSHQDFADLAPLHALGALDGPEREMFLDHLAACAECRALVAQHEEAAAGLAAGLPGAAPGAGLRDRVMDRIRADASSPSGGPRTARWPVFIQLAAAVVLLGLWVGKVAETNRMKEDLEGEKRRREAAVAEAARERAFGMRLAQELDDAKAFARNCRRMPLMGQDRAQGAVAMVSWMDRRLEWAAVGMPALPPGREYELWVFEEGKEAPMPAGTYRADEHGHVVGAFTFSGAAPNVKMFAVSVEKEGGVAAPEGPIYLLPAR